MMIEGEADFLTEEQMARAIDVGMAAIRRLCRGLALFAAKCDENMRARTHAETLTLGLHSHTATQATPRRTIPDVESSVSAQSKPYHDSAGHTMIQYPCHDSAGQITPLAVCTHARLRRACRMYEAGCWRG